MTETTTPETLAHGIAVGVLTALDCRFSPEQVEMLAAKVEAALKLTSLPAPCAAADPRLIGYSVS